MSKISLAKVTLEQSRDSFKEFPRTFADDLLDYFSEVSSIPNGLLFKKNNDEFLICDKNGNLQIFLVGNEKKDLDAVSTLKTISSLIKPITTSKPKESRIKALFCIEIEDPLDCGSEELINKDFFSKDYPFQNVDFSVGLHWEKDAGRYNLNFFPFKANETHIHMGITFETEKPDDEISEEFQKFYKASMEYLLLFLKRLC